MQAPGQTPTRKGDGEWGDDDVRLDDLVSLAQSDPRRFRAALQAAPNRCTAILAEHLKDAADRFWVIDAGVSLRLARAIVVLGRLMAEPRIVALGTMARADALRLLGEPRLALRLADSAAARYRSSGDMLGWARTRISAMGALMTLGQLHEALAVAVGARTVFRKHAEHLRLARLEANTATVVSVPRSTARCVAALRCCACTVRGAWKRRRLLRCMSGRRSIGPRCWPSWRALPRPWPPCTRRAPTLPRRGIGLLWLGQSGTSAWCCPFWIDMDRRYAPSRIHGPCWWSWSCRWRWRNSSATCWPAIWPSIDWTMWWPSPRRCVSVLETRGLILEHVGVTMVQARALQQMGHSSRALELLAHEERFLTPTSMEVWRARYALGRAAVWLSMETEVDADNARREAALARTIFRRRRLRVEAAQAQLHEAQALAISGPPRLARRRATLAARTAQALDISWMIATSQALLARLAAETGELHAAAGAFGHSIAALERMQHSMTLEMRRGFLSAEHVEAIYASAIAVAVRQRQPEQVFELIERAKSRALLDHMTAEIDLSIQHAGTTAQPLLAELAAVREEYQIYCAALTARTSEQGGALLPAMTQASLANKVRRCEQRMHALIETLHLHNPAYSDAATFRGLRLLDPRPYLMQGQLIVSYYALGEDLLIVTLDREGATTTSLPGAWPAVCTDLRLLQLNLDGVAALVGHDESSAAPALADGRGVLTDALLQREARARGILQRLWQHLLAPVAASVDRATRLTIVPYGPLHALPFSALHDGERYLVQRTIPVSVAPSASVRAALARRARRGRATADPVDPDTTRPRRRDNPGWQFAARG